MSEPAFWADAWLDDVADGTLAMSQRALRVIEAKGSIDAVIAAAQARGVHLVKLTDDTGKVLIAASIHPFETLC